MTNQTSFSGEMTRDEMIALCEGFSESLSNEADLFSEEGLRIQAKEVWGMSLYMHSSMPYSRTWAFEKNMQIGEEMRKRNGGRVISSVLKPFGVRDSRGVPLREPDIEYASQDDKKRVVKKWFFGDEVVFLQEFEEDGSWCVNFEKMNGSDVEGPSFVNSNGVEKWYRNDGERYTPSAHDSFAWEAKKLDVV